MAISGFIGFLIVIGIAAAYLRTLQKALGRCAPQNRTMTPGMVWLQMVPVLGVGWHFVNVLALGKSLEKEYLARGKTMHRPGQSLGIALGVLLIAGNGLTLMSSAVRTFVAQRASLGAVPGQELAVAPGLQVVASTILLAALVSWVIYWIRIARFSRELKGATLAVTPLPQPVLSPHFAPLAPVNASRYCWLCGTPVSSDPFCPKCGAGHQPQGINAPVLPVGGVAPS